VPWAAAIEERSTARAIGCEGNLRSRYARWIGRTTLAFGQLRMFEGKCDDVKTRLRLIEGEYRDDTDDDWNGGERGKRGGCEGLERRKAEFDQTLGL
jgi:hypothetical protein